MIIYVFANLTMRTFGNFFLGTSERCLKCGGGGVGSLRDVSKNILKQGVGKGKNCLLGRGGLKVPPTMPPLENFNHTHKSLKCTVFHQDGAGSIMPPPPPQKEKKHVIDHWVKTLQI